MPVRAEVRPAGDPPDRHPEERDREEGEREPDASLDDPGGVGERVGAGVQPRVKPGFSAAGDRGRRASGGA